MSVIALCERGYIPDPLIRWGARQISRRRLIEERKLADQDRADRLAALQQEWRQGPIAVATAAANDQHYEVPPEFFVKVLGPYLKYSCCLWDAGTNSLEAAELAMLRTTAERAGVGHGQRVLDLGCGWGSFCLWAAAEFPDSEFVAVSNSAPQGEYIMAQAKARGLKNLRHQTADINDYQPEDQFDRIVSVEMLEHVRNHPLLFSRIRQWLKADGQMFAHVFCHHSYAYNYEARGKSDWMSEHFFTGGMMPSYDLFVGYDDDLLVKQRWWHDGTHYEKTSNAWLEALDAHRDELVQILGGGREGKLRLQRWRMFFLAVAEFFGLDRGREWGVGHYLLKPQQD